MTTDNSRPTPNLQAWKELDEIFAKLKPEEFDMETVIRKTECGATCCIAGWAATTPTLRRNGVELDRPEYPEKSVGITIKGMIVFYDNLEMAELMGVSQQEWYKLTNNFGIKTPHEARLEFRKLVPELGPLE